MRTLCVSACESPSAGSEGHADTACGSSVSPRGPVSPQAAQEAVAPADILFTVKSPPQAGYLVQVPSDGAAARLPSPEPVRSFSQDTVDAGHILYMHARPDVWSDAFSVDVTSGLGAPLEGVRVELEVLPTTIPLVAENFSVPEGGTGTLAPPLLRISGPYFPSVPSLHLQVLEPPQHGMLQREGRPLQGRPATFSWREVRGPFSPGVQDMPNTGWEGSGPEPLSESRAPSCRRWRSSGSATCMTAARPWPTASS